MQTGELRISFSGCQLVLGAGDSVRRKVPCKCLPAAAAWEGTSLSGRAAPPPLGELWWLEQGGCRI